MKRRRHHNTTGYRQIKRGQTVKQVAHMAKRLKEGLCISRETCENIISKKSE
jgi:hypothetical protein